MAQPTTIVNMILDRLVQSVTADMQTAINPKDQTRANVVKKGLLQTAKVENVVQVGITGGDHEDPNYRDGIITLETMQNIGLELPPREIGGGQYWWRRGVARLECFFIASQLDENEAHEHAYVAQSRLMESIENTNPTGLYDSFHEGCIKIFVHSATFFQSGGPPAQYIFRGKVFWTALTMRPN